MKQEITEAAVNWFMNQSVEERNRLSYQYHPEMGDMDLNDEEIATIYIKEQENKEVSNGFEKIVPRSDNDIIYRKPKEEPVSVSVEESKVREITAAVFENKSETLSVEEAAKNFEDVIDKEGEGRYPVKTHTNPENSPYKGSLLTFKHGARFGSNWQKEQSEELIRELLEVLQNMDGFYHNPIVRRRLRIEQNSDEMIIQDQAKSAITKANIYLNQ